MKAKIIWSLLVIYTLIHLIWFYSMSVNLRTLLTFQGEPLAVGVFNLMGLFPVVFVTFLFCEPHKPSRPRIVSHLLGFMVGAFALLPVVSFEKQRPRHPGSLFRVLLLTLASVALALLIWMFVQGSISSYLNLFQSDSFIHIMTIDWIILYIMSVIVSKKRFKTWPLALIPVAGALLMLAIERSIET